jgi:hypothetical protein
MRPWVPFPSTRSWGGEWDYKTNMKDIYQMRKTVLGQEECLAMVKAQRRQDTLHGVWS